jgi:hypothetical protein
MAQRYVIWGFIFTLIGTAVATWYLISYRPQLREQTLQGLKAGWIADLSTTNPREIVIAEVTEATTLPKFGKSAVTWVYSIPIQKNWNFRWFHGGLEIETPNPVLSRVDVKNPLLTSPHRSVEQYLKSKAKPLTPESKTAAEEQIKTLFTDWLNKNHSGKPVEVKVSIPL